MILNVDFIYEAVVLRGRKRTPDDVSLVSTQPVEVREVEAAAAPVALRTREDRPGGGGGTREYRLFEGGLWVVHKDDEGKAPANAAWLARQAGSIADAPYGYGHPFAATTSHRGGVLGRPGEVPDLRLLRSDHDDRAAAVREAAAGILLVDGLVHRPAPEPVYEFVDEHRFSLLYVRGYTAPGKGRPLNYGISHFRADERAHMLAAFGDQGTRAADMADIEVLIPEAVRAPLPEQALLVAARVMRDDLARMVLERDAAFFGVYADLRDAMRAMEAGLAESERGGPPCETEALAAALGTAVSVVLAEDPDARRRLCVEWASAALARHEERQFASIPVFR